MFLNGRDFKTIWQLAHDWVGADPDKTDTNAVSPELQEVIHRLMLASFNEEISIRTEECLIFDKGYYINTIFNNFHFRKFKQYLKNDKFDKDYLDSLYIKRNEVLNWCAEIIYHDPPPCWASKYLSNEQVTHEDANNHQAREEKDDTFQQREAAYKRHEPRVRLKQDCIHYWLQHQNYSNKQAARRFYDQLSADKRKLFAETNAERALAQVISEYRNRKKLSEKGKFPHWLINFNPEDPQP